MPNITQSLYDIRILDELAQKNTPIHQIHPLSKLLTTCIYLLMVISFDRYEISGFFPFAFYPVMILTLAELPMRPIIKRILWVQPFIIGIGIFNPIFNQEAMLVGDFVISKGWISLISIIIKSTLTVFAAVLLLATTGMEKIAMALRVLKVPRVFVVQLLLTYRYLTVMMEEVTKTLRAYALRSPRGKGIHRSAWGSLAGQMLLRTYDRAQRIYQAMCLRGFVGDYPGITTSAFQVKDVLYFVLWSAFFIFLRVVNISELIGFQLTYQLK